MAVAPARHTEREKTNRVPPSSSPRPAAFDRLPVSRKGVVVVLVPLLFQVLFLLLVAANETGHREAREREIRSREVIASTYRLLGLLVDAETGMRGYAVTGNAVFLEPYERALREIPSQLDELGRVSDGELRNDVARISAAAARAIEFHKTQRPRPPRRIAAAIATLEGKRRMDAFRATIAAFLRNEEQLALKTRARANRGQSRLLTTLAFGLLADVAIALSLTTLFSRGITARLATVTANTLRVERNEPLAEPMEPGDEIAALDHRLHSMAEAIAAAQQNMERANADLASFSYSVSHDLRAPVRAINGYSQMIEEDYATSLDDEGRRYLGTVRSEARRMGHLIDDLLAFSRLTVTPLTRSDVDMTALAEDVINDLRRDGADATEFQIGELPPALGDRSLLRQVFVNLLTNAVKFSRHAERPRIEVRAELNDRELVYLVRDNGVGFDMAYAGKLFGVFQRLHKFDEFEGTGVGLAIVQRVIARHGGRVWAEAEPQRGATFFFTLPAAPAGETAERKAKE